MAKLYFRYGAMGSSKTANAIMVRYNYLERGQKVLMLKPKLDSRDGETMVASRCGLSCACGYMEDIDTYPVEEYDCVIVDEAQFLTKAQVEKLVEIVDDRHVPVIAYGLRTDFPGQPVRRQPVAAGLGGHHRGGQDHLLVRQEGHLQRPHSGRQGRQGRRAGHAGRQ